jgi:hypothetical protein
VKAIVLGSICPSYSVQAVTSMLFLCFDIRPQLEDFFHLEQWDAPQDSTMILEGKSGDWDRDRSHYFTGF